eukprot:5279781-Pyramimonas_sp.AAC.1
MAQGRDVPQVPLEWGHWRPEMQLLRQPLLVLWIAVDQQVAPHIAAACWPQGWDKMGPSSSFSWA